MERNFTPHTWNFSTLLLFHSYRRETLVLCKLCTVFTGFWKIEIDLELTISQSLYAFQAMNYFANFLNIFEKTFLTRRKICTVFLARFLGFKGCFAKKLIS
jgi:hypothetical protein